MRKLTGLYLSKSKKGETFMSGKTPDGVKFFVFKNNKTSNNHPDYNLYVEDGTENPRQDSQNYQKNPPKQESYDEIPF